MTSRRWTFACTSLLFVLWTNASRADNTPLDHSYFAAKLTLGIGGSGSLTSDSISFAGVTATTDRPAKSSDDLELSYGLAVQYMVPVHTYFVIGGLFGITSWKTDSADSDASRNLALDLAVVPEGRIPVLRNLELYLAVPVGLTFDWFNQIESHTTVGNVASASISADTAVGFMISILLGARFAVLDSFGLFAEVGYIHRQFSHEITGSGSVFGVGGSTKANADISMGQFALNLGAYF
jgi:hypothetical protein